MNPMPEQFVFAMVSRVYLLTTLEGFGVFAVPIMWTAVRG